MSTAVLNKFAVQVLYHGTKLVSRGLGTEIVILISLDSVTKRKPEYGSKTG